MGCRQGDRKRRPARRPPTRAPKRRLLVVCEGEVTEPEYLRGCERHLRNARVQLEVAREHGVPLTLVRTAKQRKKVAEAEARREKDDFAAFDEVWCVFDVDQHPGLKAALQEARDSGIEVALSNPCFELWLLLHFRESPGAQDRHAAQAMLRQYLPNYDKHLDFVSLAAGLPLANRRARRLDEAAAEIGDPPHGNPSTGVYRLTESMAR